MTPFWVFFIFFNSYYLWSLIIHSNFRPNSYYRMKVPNHMQRKNYNQTCNFVKLIPSLSTSLLVSARHSPFSMLLHVLSCILGSEILLLFLTHFKNTPLCFHKALWGYLFLNQYASLRTYNWLDECFLTFWALLPLKVKFIQTLYSTVSNNLFMKHNAFLFSIHPSWLLCIIGYYWLPSSWLSNSMTLMFLFLWLQHWLELCLLSLPQRFASICFFHLATCFV